MRLQYAADRDVLIVHAAGNEAKNIDDVNFFPNDSKNSLNKFINNFINVGATTRNLNERLVAPFSNYGRNRVDIFAPGTEIYSTISRDQYEMDQGTSMAAPVVAGIAALIRSYFPGLTAGEVKQVILNSGVPYRHLVIIPGAGVKATDFTNLSVSGKSLMRIMHWYMRHHMSGKNLSKAINEKTLI